MTFPVEYAFFVCLYLVNFCFNCGPYKLGHVIYEFFAVDVCLYGIIVMYA